MHETFFAPRSRVAFVGDSITAAGSFMGYIGDYLVTRSPGQPVFLYNLGLSGGNIPDALSRIDWDIAAKTPDRAVVMFGMNDISRDLYAKAVPQSRRRKPLEDFRIHMAKLVEKLREIGAEEIALIAPTPYEQYARMAEPNAYGCDDALVELGAFVRQYCADNDLYFVDLHTPMREENRRLQAADPAASLVGPDRVHPPQSTHFLMAHWFLLQMGADPLVASIRTDAATGKTRTVQAEAICTHASSERIALTYTPRRLPLPVCAQYKEALAHADITGAMNREILVFDNLHQGVYRLRLDNQEAGEYTVSQLEEGINIAALDQNPNAPAAMAVHEKNFWRINHEGLYRQGKFFLTRMRKNNINRDDHEAVEQYMNNVIAEFNDNPFVVACKERYYRYGDETPLAPILKEGFDTVYEKNRPRQYEITLARVQP